MTDALGGHAVNDEKCGGETEVRKSDNMIEVWRRRRLDRVVVDVLEKIFYR